MKRGEKFCFRVNLTTMLLCFSIIFYILSSNINLKNESNCLLTNEVVITKEIIENTQNAKEFQIIDNSIWKLNIPKICLEASISEGTSSEILNKYIGHFEETQKAKGNIGLAAHNRGYDVNYFERIKELEIGDEIYYTYNGKTSVYIVESKTIIKDTDWTKLENTKDNKLTLITCVENQPQYRRCVQAIERK